MLPNPLRYFTLAFIALHAVASAQSPSLGGADSFSVLAGTTVTNTGPTIINGNLGVSPGSAITGFPPGTIVNGTTYTGVASLAGQAHADTVTAYNTIAGKTPTANLTGQDLGGLTLTPGVYKFNSSAQLTGALRLDTGGDPNAVFHFQIGSTLTTAAASSVTTLGLGGATDKNIFWQIGSSATLGANTTFQGNILALTSITLLTGASIQGRALAINGAVTLASNNISNAALLAAGTTGTTGTTGAATGAVAVVALVPTATLVTMAVVALPDNSLAVVPLQNSFQDLPALTPNQASVAAALDRLASHNLSSALVVHLDTLNRDLLAAQYDLLSPVDFAAIFDAGFASAQLQSGNIERRLESIRDGSANDDGSSLSTSDTHGALSAMDPKDGKRIIGDTGKTFVNVAPNRRWGFFITGAGEWVDIESTSKATGSNFITGGVTVGADYRLTDHLAIGLSAGYANTRSDGVGDGKIDRNNANANAYATWSSHGFYLNGIIGGGYSSYKTRRESVGGLARGDTDGADYSGSLGTGYEFRMGGLTLGPIAAIQYATIGLNGFTEHGSLAPLHLGNQSENSLASQAGARVSYAWKVGRTVVTPELRAQWRHEFQDSSRGIGATFADDSTASFNVHGPQIGRDSLILDFGASVQLSQRTSLFAYYTGDFGATNYTAHSINGGMRVNF